MKVSKVFFCLIFMISLLGFKESPGQKMHLKDFAFTLTNNQGAVIGYFKGVDGLSDALKASTGTSASLSNLTLKRGIISSSATVNSLREQLKTRSTANTLFLHQFDRSGNRIQTIQLEGTLLQEGGEYSTDSSTPVCYLKYKLDRCFVKSWSTSG